MISIDNLSVSFGGWTLFDQISFLINPKDRVGLVGRNGTPMDVAAAMVYLAEAEFVTGQVLPVNVGLVL